MAQRSVIDRNEKDLFATQYKGSNWFADSIHKHQVSQVITLLSGINAQRLAYGQEEVNDKDTTSFILVDPYTSLFVEVTNGFNLHAGVRLNTHSEYGNAFLYNINPSWQFKINSSLTIKILASLATAYITPTLFQLHTTWGGNRNLKPEEDMTAEYGATFSIRKNLQLTIVNFYREEKNSIGYSTDFQYVNTTGKRYVNGVTMDARWIVFDELTFRADYAFVTTNLETTFYRIPNHKAGISSNYQAPFGTNLSVRYQFTGTRTDIDYPNEVQLDSFSLVDISVSHKFLSQKLLAYASVSNLFDKDFIGVYGYTTRGRNFTLGLTYNF
jgi:vitamin B12 transporter